MQDSADRSAQLAFVGDLMLARKVSAALVGGRAPEAFWGDLRPLLLDTDGLIGNLECALTADSGLCRGGHKLYHFCADPRAVEILAAGNVRCVNLANNHTFDAGPKGLAATIDHLDAAGIAHAGAGENAAAAAKPAIFHARGLAIGFASLTNTLKAFGASPDRPGTNYTRVHANPVSRALMESLVADMDARGAEVKILGIHWGPNLRPWPPRRYRAFARQAIEAGFTVVHGHSAHLVQAVEFHQEGLILYDTGNFLDDYWVFPGIRIDRSFLFRVEVSPRGAPRLRLLPVLIGDSTVRSATGDEGAAIRRSMVRRCAGYSVEFRVDGHELMARRPGEGFAAEDA